MNRFEELNNKLRAASSEELEQIIASSGMPLNVQQIAGEELDRLSVLSPETAEHANGLNYIGYLISLPWNEKTETKPDLKRIETALSESRYYSRNIGEKIWKHLSVKLLSDDKKPKILVVEDEKIALESVVDILRRDGHEVVPANNGAEAIEKLKASDFDVVVTDLIMGEVDGQAVLKETKSRYPDTRIIMITGYATVDTAVQALRQGAFHYIEKPVKLDEVRAIVKDAIREKLHAGSETVLCFEYSSETEMTSLGKTIADTIGKKFYNISLSAMKDESEIIGQNRATGGAKAGCIIEAIRSVGVSNPVLMLGELDMIGQDFKGDFASALPEVLDPAKNQKFVDRYLDLPFDLSDVIFIVTANNADNIQSPLRDLLEIVKI